MIILIHSMQIKHFIIDPYNTGEFRSYVTDGETESFKDLSQLLFLAG